MNTLFDNEPNSIQARFEQFHAENPRVYDLFRQFAEQVRRMGHTRYSADAILHRIRWHMTVDTRSDDFKLNNNFASRYARLLMDDDATFDGFFEVRQLKTA